MESRQRNAVMDIEGISLHKGHEHPEEHPRGRYSQIHNCVRMLAIVCYHGRIDPVNWPWLCPLTHRERRHTVASHMERTHTETHKNATQETQIETLRNTEVVAHIKCILKQRKTVNHSFFYFDLLRATPVPFIHKFNKNPI